jgi:hypothetical protein
MKIIFATFFLLTISLVQAGPPRLVDSQTGKYLGNLSSNPYDQNSTSNPYGKYGSEYSADSINNPYGNMGVNTVTIALITPMQQIRQQ